MGLLTLFAKAPGSLLKLPSGSFTIDCEGRVLVGTLPSSFPQALVAEIARDVLATFRGAESAQLPLSELIINFPSLKITARELRGGALVFLSPRPLSAPGSQN